MPAPAASQHCVWPVFRRWPCGAAWQVVRSFWHVVSVVLQVPRLPVQVVSDACVLVRFAEQVVRLPLQVLRSPVQVVRLACVVVRLPWLAGGSTAQSGSTPPATAVAMFVVVLSITPRMAARSPVLGHAPPASTALLSVSGHFKA